MREEYGFDMGIGAYTIAVCVAFLRLYNGRHWLNDVIAGRRRYIICKNRLLDASTISKMV